MVKIILFCFVLICGGLTEVTSLKCYQCTNCASVKEHHLKECSITSPTASPTTSSPTSSTTSPTTSSTTNSPTSPTTTTVPQNTTSSTTENLNTTSTTAPTTTSNPSTTKPFPNSKSLLLIANPSVSTSTTKGPNGTTTTTTVTAPGTTVTSSTTTGPHGTSSSTHVTAPGTSVSSSSSTGSHGTSSSSNVTAPGTSVSTSSSTGPKFANIDLPSKDIELRDIFSNNVVYADKFEYVCYKIEVNETNGTIIERGCAPTLFINQTDCLHQMPEVQLIKSCYSCKLDGCNNGVNFQVSILLFMISLTVTSFN